MFVFNSVRAFGNQSFHSFQRNLALGFHDLIRGCCSSSSRKKASPLLPCKNVEMQMGCAPNNWEDLHEDLLELIAQHLDLVSIIRCSAVCKSWRCGMKNRIGSMELLWLMLPYEPFSKHLSFYDLSEQTIRNLALPKPIQGTDCIFKGFSSGWLVVRRDMQIFLFNPISMLQISLPPVTTILSRFRNLSDLRSHRMIDPIQVYCVEGSPCIIAAIFAYEALAFCTPHDEEWTIIEELAADTGEYYQDMIFAKDGTLNILFNREPHAMNEQNMTSLMDDNEVATVQTRSIRFAGHEIILKSIPNVCSPGFHAPPNLYPFDESQRAWVLTDSLVTSYLMESKSHELLIVHRISDCWSKDYIEFDNGRIAVINKGYFGTRKFEVFQIQIQPTNLILKSRLWNLERDQSLFISSSSGLSISTRGFHGFKENCIYFLDDLGYHYEDYRPISRESGVFCLDDGKIQRFLPSVQTEKQHMMLWFRPDIQIKACT